nr:hypothetical protein [Tanacetum cinerariifolium]
MSLKERSSHDHGACSFWGGVVEVVESVGDVEEWQESGERRCLKIDSLLEEFSSELAHINFILSRINEADFDPEEEICLIEKLLYDNSSSRPPEEPNFDDYSNYPVFHNL